MRIQVLFDSDDTWVVVPCGDGKITINELVNRATVRFKKITNTHHDDVLCVGSISLHHKGTYVDREDEVADILKNNEAVILQQTYWVGCVGSDKSNPQVTMPKTSQDTKVLSGKRTCSVQSVDSGFIATQYSRDNSQDGIQNSQTTNLQQQPSPFHLTVSSLSPSPLLGVAGRPLAHPLQRVKQDSRMALWGTKHHHRPESGVLIDEDDDTDTDLEKENFDSSKKHTHPDESGNNSGVQEYPDVRPYTSLSEHSRTPSPLSSKDIDDTEQFTDKEEEEEEEDTSNEYGEIHVIEVYKGKKPLGIHLIDSTLSKGAPGMFIGAMDEDGAAFKSSKFHTNDRILACNGVDFTKDHSEPVKDIFNRMSQEPLLRIAIGREVGIPTHVDVNNGGTKEGINDDASSSNEATLTTPMDTITIAHNSGECDHHLTSHDDEIIVGDDISSVGVDSEVTTTTVIPSYPMPQIVVSQQNSISPSQQSNPKSTLEQLQEQPFLGPNITVTVDDEKMSTDMKPTKGEESSSAAEIDIPQVKSIIGPGKVAWDLRCVEVCGETTVMVRQSAQQFTWEGFGLKLHIYADCLPADMEQCNIHIKASPAGLYEFPKNTRPVSAVFWLRCVPECKFGKSIGLEIQHCGKPTGDSRLSFARALCCQKELPYTFKDIGGDFTNHSFYGFIELKGFSGLAVVQEGSEERYYLASLLYKEISNIRSRCIVEIYIALTWNVDAHYSILVSRFKDASIEVQQPIEFESDQVEFKISNISHEKWDIRCLNSPVVKKTDVDRFTPGKTSWVPSSKFKAKFSDDLNLICDLECDVDVIGAMQPHNKFVVDICPQAGSSQQPQYTPTLAPAQSTSTRLSDFDCTSTLLQQLKIHAAKWREIGTHLGFRPGELDNIHSNALHLSTDLPIYCLSEMLTRWLQWAPGDNRGSTNFATLEALKAALTQAGLGAAAHGLHL